MLYTDTGTHTQIHSYIRLGLCSIFVRSVCFYKISYVRGGLRKLVGRPIERAACSGFLCLCKFERGICL